MKDKIHISLLEKERDKEVFGYFAHLLPDEMNDISSAWEFVGAFYEETPCGILAYIVDDEILIPWIYVDEAYRRRTIGSQMIETLRNNLEEKLLFTGFSCEIILDMDGSGLDLIDFFASMDDFDITPKCCIYEILPSIYKKAFAEQSLFKNANKIVAEKYVDIPAYQKIAFRNTPKVSDSYQIDQMNKWGENIEKDLSLCIIDEDKVASAILVTDIGDDKLSVELLYGNGMESLLKLLAAFGQALINQNNNKSLIFRAVNEKIIDLAAGFFSEIMVYGEVWEASTF